MNCKQGDLAIVVQSLSGNEGKVVRCVELVGTVTYRLQGKRTNCWRVDPPLPSITGPRARFVPDSCLRPIRPQDGEDETLTWAGKPEQITA